MAKKAAPEKQPDPIGSAILGAFLGGMLVVAHEGYDIVTSQFPGGDPFLHVLGEFAIFSGGGALVFGFVAEIRNRRRTD